MSSNYSFKPLTDTSWILHNEGNRIALITEKNGVLTAIGKLEQRQFESIKALEKYLGGKISIEVSEEDTVDELGAVNGYPVKHVGAVQLEHDSLPVYKKSANSTAEYAAGYYGIHFPNGWVHSYCPRLQTLVEHEYIGPYTTKLEMQNSISQKKRELDL